MKINSPCKGCTDRTLGCHGICEDYKAYSEYMTKLRDKRTEAVHLQNAIMDIAPKNYCNTVKKNSRY